MNEEQRRHDRAWNDPPLFSYDQLNKQQPNAVPLNRRYKYPAAESAQAYQAPQMTAGGYNPQQQTGYGGYGQNNFAQPSPYTQMAGQYGMNDYNPAFSQAPQVSQNSYMPSGYGQIPSMDPAAMAGQQSMQPPPMGPPSGNPTLTQQAPSFGPPVSGISSSMSAPPLSNSTTSNTVSASMNTPPVSAMLNSYQGAQGYLPSNAQFNYSQMPPTSSSQYTPNSNMGMNQPPSSQQAQYQQQANNVYQGYPPTTGGNYGYGQ